MIDKHVTLQGIPWGDRIHNTSGKTLAMAKALQPRQSANQQLVQAALVRAAHLLGADELLGEVGLTRRRDIMSTLAAQLRDAGMPYGEIEQTISRMVRVIRHV